MFISVNNVELYYEKSGNGEPLIMLHGNGETHKIFNTAVNILNKHYTVYTIDFRNHGQSSKVEKYSYSDHVEDIFQFIKTLQIDSPVLYGFSDGGIVGIMLAAKYPELLKKAIVSGPNVTPDGIKPFYIWLWKLLYIITESPNIGLMLNEPNISDEELLKIKTPVIITGGRFDLVTQKHLKLVNKKINGSILRIFPFQTHSSYIVNSKIIADFILSV